MASIRVLIAGDQRLFRKGLRQVCETLGGFEVVGEAADGHEAVRLAQELQPDVVLIDTNIPGPDGVQITRAILDQNPFIAIIILTANRQEQGIFEMIKAGARGYLLKDSDEQEIIGAIRSVHRGDALIAPDMAGRLIAEFRRIGQLPAGTEKDNRLTDGEMAVLRLVAQGEDNKGIAKRLEISENTVANRLRRIYRKMHVSNRTQAALEALRRGWVVLDEEE